MADPVDWYRLGDGHLALRSADDALRVRLRTLHEDCAVPGPSAVGPRVTCTVRVTAEWFLAVYDDPEPLDATAFALAVFSDRGYVERPEPAEGWRLLEAEAPLLLAGNEVLGARPGRWQRFIGNMAVSRVLRLQRDVIYFHAAAVAVGDRGVLLVGPKGAGKTTLALAVAAAGHGFLGDELVGVRPRTATLVPVRRSVTIKPGPAAAAVEDALRRIETGRETFPDGVVRQRVPASRLCGTAWPEPPALGAVVFLEPFAPTPVLTRLPSTRDVVRRLPPLAASFWGMSPARRAAELASLTARVPCYLLTPGSPDETAALLIRSVEG